MRRITICLLAWVLAILTILPVLAQNNGGLRINRDGGWGADFDSAFQSAPRQEVRVAPSRGYAVDANAFQSAPPPPVLDIAPSNSFSAGSFVKQLAPRELNVLSSRDVILLIDKSGSMSEKDCPPPRDGLRFLYRIAGGADPVSRWDWCENELINMSRLTSSAMRQGMRVVLFSTDQTAYERVRMDQIPEIFRRNYPQGSTNAAPALKRQLDWYFSNRVTQRDRSRPVVIAVITDGLPNNTRALKKAILDATASMQRPDEIAITFLQIGADRQGVRLVHELDDDLVRQGAVFDIVDSKDFGELLNIGLARALIAAIGETNRVAGRGY